MLTVVPVALVLLASAPAAGSQSLPPEPAQAGAPAPPPAAASSDKAPPAAAAAAQSCQSQTSNERQIFICTQRPQGYRLNPDVMEAKREMRSGGRPPRPGGTVVPDCKTVGPAPCFNAGINLLAAAATAAEMAKRLAKGQEVGSMFVTDPHPSEYQLYLMAKARREQLEAEKAGAVKAAQARAEAAKAAAAKSAAAPASPAVPAATPVTAPSVPAQPPGN